MTLSVVIVNYNTKKLLKNCIKSMIDDQWLMANSELIVVDNGSTDGSREYLKSLEFGGIEFSKRNEKQKYSNSKLQTPDSRLLKVIFNDQNLGFAKAVNQGINKSTGKYILLLNTDTTVKKNSVKKMIDFVREHSDAGIAAPQLLNPDNSVQPSCFKLPTICGAVKKFWLGRTKAFGKYAPDTEHPVAVEAAVAAVWLLPRSTVNKVGLFNEQFFMYYEDIDYCRRLQKYGLKIYYLPDAKVVHLHGASGKKLKEKPSQWLKESSKKYHGIFKHYLINFIIKTGQICQS